MLPNYLINSFSSSLQVTLQVEDHWELHVWFQEIHFLSSSLQATLQVEDHWGVHVWF